MRALMRLVGVALALIVAIPVAVALALAVYLAACRAAIAWMLGGAS